MKRNNLLTSMIFILIILLLYVIFFEPSISYCMDCKYVQDNMGQIQLHPKTGEPLQNCSKTDFVVAMETIEKIAKDTFTNTNSNHTSVPNVNSSTSPDNCSNCK